jgi:hypothetical protein
MDLKRLEFQIHGIFVRLVIYPLIRIINSVRRGKGATAHLRKPK